jgi:Rho GDP-dissociation inhibitor
MSEAPVGGELVSEITSVFQVPKAAASTIEEILAKDTEDESLRKYKESLLGAAITGNTGDKSDPRRVIVDEFIVMFAPEEQRSDLVYRLDTAEGIEDMNIKGITLKENVKYKFMIKFRVQHDILHGLKFVNTVSRMLLSDTDELMIGSYPPSSNVHVFEFPRFDYETAPSGMMYRGKYSCKSTFIDQDNNKHLEFKYNLHIKDKW